jgi:hypothetical protein
MFDPLHEELHALASRLHAEANKSLVACPTETMAPEVRANFDVGYHTLKVAAAHFEMSAQIAKARFYDSDADLITRTDGLRD